MAVKILASNLARDPEIIERFVQEAQLQANLKHPGIVAAPKGPSKAPWRGEILESP